jgi:hypothetical protein
VEVDAVGEQLGEASAVALDLARGAAAFAQGLAGLAARTGLRCHLAIGC